MGPIGYQSGAERRSRHVGGGGGARGQTDSPWPKAAGADYCERNPFGDPFYMQVVRGGSVGAAKGCADSKESDGGKREFDWSPVSPKFTGPFVVLEKGPKAFKLQLGQKQDWVSVDRLKTYVEGRASGEDALV